MKRNTTTSLAFAGITLLALTGCGQSTPTESPTESAPPASESVTADPQSGMEEEMATAEADEPTSFPAGEDYWFVTMDNAVGKFTLPDAEPYAAAEELRSLVDGEPVSYATVTVDNREGMSGVNMYELAAFDVDGQKYTFQTVDTALEEWSADIGTETNEDIELYNAFVDAINEHMTFADVGQVETFVMASTDTELPDEFTRISVQAHGAGNEVDAYPTSDAEGVDLDFEDPDN